MNDEKLDAFLQRLRNEPIPPPPSNLGHRVLSEIRRTSQPESPSALSLLGFLSNSFAAQLRFASLIALLAMGTGLVVGSVYALPPAEADLRPKRSAAALSLDVFSPDAARIPRRLLEK